MPVGALSGKGGGLLTGRGGRLRAVWTGEFMAGVVLPAVVVPTAFNSGVNLLYLLGSLLLAYMLLAVAMGLWNMRSVSGGVVGPWTFEEGQPVRVRTQVVNQGRASAFDVSVRLPLEGVADHPVARVATLAPGAQAREDTRCDPLGRGVYPVTRFHVESPFPIGFMTTRRRVVLDEADHEELVVLPRILGVDFREAFGQDQTLEGEDILIHGVKGGQTFHGVRPYLYGDPLKHIHWKAMARVGKPMVKEFQRPLQARYYLFLDLDASQQEGEGSESNLEYLVRLAASLGAHLGRGQALYHFVWSEPGKDGEPRTRMSEAFGGGGDVDRARRLLAGLGYNPETRLRDMVTEAVPTLSPGCRLVFFVPRDTAAVPDEIAGLGYPSKAIFLVQAGRDDPEATLDPAGETGLAAGVDLYRYSIDQDRLDHEHR